MAGHNRTLDRLMSVQQQLFSVPDALLQDYVKVAGDLYAPMFFAEFGLQQLAVHSLNSFIVRRDEDKKIVFGECFHIGEAVSVGIEVSRLDTSRILYIELDATAIATPPGEEYDPFFESIKLPVAAIEDIRAA